MSKFQAGRVRDAIERLDGSEEANAALDQVFQTVPWHEAEVILAELGNDADELHDAVAIALARYTGTMH